MANLHLVTGYAGQEHVTSADAASLNVAVIGGGQYVLNRGNQFAASVVSNNQIRVSDGDILMQGRHIRLNEDTYVDLTIENGTQGYLRSDLIVARYSKNSSTGIEECNLVVIKGENAASNPTDPEYTVGNIINGDLTNDMPLYRVPLDGLNVGELVPMFDFWLPVDTDRIYRVGAIYMSTDSTSPASLFGGTWERLKDTFLLAAGDTYSAGATGGEAEVTLTTAQMPTHRHVNSYGGNFYGTKGSGDGEVAGLTTGTGFSGSDANSGVVRAPANDVGGNEAHNNMPPYLAVYMWKRTA